MSMVKEKNKMMSLIREFVGYEKSSKSLTDANNPE
jgi:hypothetical protein